MGANGSRPVLERFAASVPPVAPTAHFLAPQTFYRSAARTLTTLAGVDDKHLWLEDVTGEEQLNWVRQRNSHSTRALGEPVEDKEMYGRFLSIMDSTEKIPYVQSKVNGQYLNFWKDKDNKRGLWRRIDPDAYLSGLDSWEILLDVDALGQEEGKSWVYKGHRMLYEGPGIEQDLCLVFLSDGGADATVVREFSIKEKRFLTEAEDAFEVPEAKTRVSYQSRDVLLVGTESGPDSLTTSGYPRLVQRWRRGTPLSEAETIFEGQADDVSVSASRYLDRGHLYELCTRSITFYTSEAFVAILDPDDPAAPAPEFTKIPVPEDATIDTFADQLLVTLRSEWQPPGAANPFPSGSLLSLPLAPFLRQEEVEFMALFVPTATRSLDGYRETRNFLLLDVLDDVKSCLTVFEFAPGQVGVGGPWVAVAEEAERAPGIATLSVWGEHARESDLFWLTTQGYATPTTLFLCDARAGVLGPDHPKARKVRSLPHFYADADVEATQHFVSSKDGERIPYFLVHKRGLERNGENPTLLYGYGGFEISMQPGYASIAGVGWIEEGGVYVVANIRGGGEYGPRWHQAALKADRQKAYDDFLAVARDLCDSGITCPSRLGIRGGSNGGLLMGNMLVQAPEQFGAICCEVPLLDMKRFHLLLAGASWRGEYGDPDIPEEWTFLQKYSPYQLVDISGATDYPPTLFATSTRDDRVHPGHARKMVARMLEQASEAAQEKVLYYENIEGGHGGAADSKQFAYKSTLTYSFLWKILAPERKVHLKRRKPEMHASIGSPSKRRKSSSADEA